MALGDFLFPHLKAKLIIAHLFKSDIEGARNKYSDEYAKVTATIRLNRNDLQRLSLQDGGKTTITSGENEITVTAFGDDNLPEGIALMPYGPWALALIDVPDEGEPLQLHGIEVIIKRSDNEITSLQSLFVS